MVIHEHVVRDGDLAVMDDNSVGIVIGDKVHCVDKVTAVANAHNVFGPDEFADGLNHRLYTALRAVVTRRRKPLPMAHRKPVDGDLVVTTQLDTGLLLGGVVYCANKIVKDTVIGVVNVNRGKTLATYRDVLLDIAQDNLTVHVDDLFHGFSPMNTRLIPGHVYLMSSRDASALVYLGTGHVVNMYTNRGHKAQVIYGPTVLVTALGNVLDVRKLLRCGRTPGRATERELMNLAVVDHQLVTTQRVTSANVDKPKLEIWPHAPGITVDIGQVSGWVDGELRVTIDDRVHAVFTPDKTR